MATAKPSKPKAQQASKSAAPKSKGPAKTGKAAKAPARKPAQRGSRRKKPAKTKLKAWLIIGCVILLAIVGLLYWLHNTQFAPSQTITGVEATQGVNGNSHGYIYEEPLHQDLLAVESAIYGALQQAGITMTQTELWVDINKGEESARLEVTLAPNQDMGKVAELLTMNLKSTPARAAWQKQTGFWHLEVYLDESLSHQVNLRASATSVSRAPAGPSMVEPARGKPKLAIIVDDVGLNKAALRRLMDLKLALTFSVLPYAKDSEATAKSIKARGFELWLHLPMEPLGNSDPGPDALYTNADKDILQKLTRQALLRVPGAVGVNNHMGSRFTQSAKALAGPLQVIRDNNLMFVDSLTSASSVACQEARNLGISSGRRDIFLDHDIDEQSILRQLKNVVNMAVTKGQAIAICHPHAATIKVLSENQHWLNQKVDVVFASHLLR